jgi:integrase
MRTKRSSPPGIRIRHSRKCAAGMGDRCTCRPSYEAWVFSRRDRRKLRRTFPTLAAAKAWRHDAAVGLRKGILRAPSRATLREAAETWLAGAKDGTVRTRSGTRYKPSAIRGYEAALRGRVLVDLGGVRLSELQRVDLQDLADRLVASGLDPSTVRNALMPLRAIYRRAVSRGDVAVNPTTGLELPAVTGRRERIAAPDEAARLLEALPDRDRALWATALYAGLRRGELQALRWNDVDLAGGVIRVERSYDEKAREFIEPKTAAARRTVPIAAVLRDHLDEHKVHGSGDGLVFGATGDKPFVASGVWRRAQSAWRAREFDPIGLHEGRHTFASLMIAAGVNAKALSTYMGHSSVTITYDRYGHLMPGNEAEAAKLLDAYLVRADTEARLAQLAT